MTIAEELTALSGRIQDAYTALAAKGATMPATRNSYNLSATIDTVPTGGTSVYGITSPTQVVGKVVNGNLQLSGEPFDFVATGVVSYGNNILTRRFQYNDNIRSATFPDFVTIVYPMEYTFVNCTNLTSITFTKLESIVDVQGALRGLCTNCTSLQSVSFPALKTIRADGLTSSSAFYQMLQGTSIRSLTFPELLTLKGTSGSSGLNTSIFGQVFGNAVAGDFYFPKVNDISGICFANVAHTLHFAAANRTAIESATGYSNKFGLNTSGQILFDL